MNLIYYIPLYYLYRTRLRSPLRLISWIGSFIIPTLFFTLVNASFSLNAILLYTLALISLYCIYEIGYIQNDAETIKKETEPTLRLKTKELAYYEKNKIKIYSSRFILAILLSVLLIYCNTDKTGSFLFVSLIWSTLLLYQIHNNIRNRVNLYMHIVMVGIRYCSIPLIYFENLDYKWLLISFFCYPVANFIERASEKRFREKWAIIIISDRNKIPLYRVSYYLFFSTISLFLVLLDSFSLLMTIPFLYYLAYRTVLFSVSNKYGSKY